MAEGCGRPVQGHQDPLHLGSNPADRRSRQAQERVHRADRHRSRNRDRAARAGSRQGDAGRAGPARHLRPLLSRPVLGCDLRPGHHRSGASTTRTSRTWPCRASTSTTSPSRWSTGLAVYEGKWVGIPFDIPIFIADVPQGHPREARHRGPDHLRPNSPRRSRRSPRPRRPTACSAPASRPSRATTR